LQKIRPRVELDVQVPAELRCVCSLGAHLRLFDAECVRHFLVGVRGRIASGSNRSLSELFEHFNQIIVNAIAPIGFIYFSLLIFSTTGLHYGCHRRTCTNLGSLTNLGIATLCNSCERCNASDVAVCDFSLSQLKFEAVNCFQN
jgi:hypothetical protein